MKLTINLDTVDLNGDEDLNIHIGGPDSWTSIVVQGNGTVSFYEQGREIVSINLKNLAKQLATEK